MCCHFVWQAKSSRADTAIVLRSCDCYCWSLQARLSSKSAKRRNLNLTLAHTHAGSSPRQEVSCWYTIKCLLKINLKVSAASVNLADWVMTVPSGGVTKRPQSALVNDFSFFFLWINIKIKCEKPVIILHLRSGMWVDENWSSKLKRGLSVFALSTPTEMAVI